MATKRTTKKKTSITWVHVFLFIITMGIAYYFWQNNNKKTETADTIDTASPQQMSSNVSASKKQVFPLEAGSYSNFVEDIQHKLNDVFNAGITKFGYLGTFTAQFLKDKGFSLPITKETYDKIMLLEKNYQKISTDLHLSVRNRDIKKALNILKSISNIDEYLKVKVYFEQVKIGFSRKSVVTALLDTFTASYLPESATNRQYLEAEFLRIGLKKTGTKWSI